MLFLTTRVRAFLKGFSIQSRASARLSATAQLPPIYSVHFSVAWTILWMTTWGLTVLLAVLLMFPVVFPRSETLDRFRKEGTPARNGLVWSSRVRRALAGQANYFLFPAIVWLGRFGRSEDGVGLVLDGLGLVMGCYLISVGLLGFAFYPGLNDRECPALARAARRYAAPQSLLTLSFTSFLWSRELWGIASMRSSIAISI